MGKLTQYLLLSSVCIMALANSDAKLSVSIEIKGGTHHSRLISDVPNEDVIRPADDENGHRLSEYTREFFQTLSIPVRESYDKIPYTFGGRVVGLYQINDTISASLYAGVDTGIQSGDTMGTYAETVDLSVRDHVVDDEDLRGTLENRSGPTMEEDLHIVGGVRFGFRHLSVFSEYDVSQLKVSGNLAVNSRDALNGEHKFNNILLGARAETVINFGEFDMNLFMECASNFSQKVSLETESYVLALSKAYLTDLVGENRSGGLPTSTHASIFNLSLGLGFNFVNI